jgi:hypothetical protein
MKITDSTLSLVSAHDTLTRDVSRESLHVWRQGSEPQIRQAQGDPAGRLRQQAMALLQRPPEIPADTRQARAAEPALATALADGEEPLSGEHRLEMSLLRLLVERLTGRSIQLVTPGDLKPCADELGPQSPSHGTETAPQREGWGMVYQNYSSHYEAERTQFQAQGLIRTADGLEIQIQIELSMSREFFTESSLTLRAGDALKDPLVINFEGRAAELTRQSYSFDIDADGVSEQIHFVAPGSGFLALDRNGDGMINDGSELFGPQSGDGFAELSRHDSDGNGWIDENDPIFGALRIWSRDAQGEEQLVALGARGIGAIYLGHITTPFEIKNGENQLLGVVRDSGLYLGEEGNAGTVQQLDLVV